MTFKHFLAATAILVLAGCGSGSPKDPSDFTYDPPQGFVQQDKQRGPATVFLGPKDDNFQANLEVQSGKTDQKAQQYGQANLGKHDGDSSVKVKEQEAFTIPDSDAYTWLIAKTGKSGKVADQRQFVVIKNGIFVEFTMTGLESAFPGYDQALADSMKSFKWGRS